MSNSNLGLHLVDAHIGGSDSLPAPSAVHDALLPLREKRGALPIISLMTRLVRYQYLPDRDAAGSSIPAEVDALGHEASAVIFAVPGRNGRPVEFGGAAKRADYVADRVVYLDHWSTGADRLQPDRHLSGHHARADGQTRPTLNRWL